MFKLENITNYYLNASHPFQQLAVVAFCLSLALGLRVLLRRNRVIKARMTEQVSSFLLPLISSISFVLLLAFAQTLYSAPTLIHLSMKLTVLWLVFSMFHGPMKKAFVTWVIAAFIVPAVVLDILGLFNPLQAYLESFVFSLGPIKINLLQIPEFILYLSIMLWIAIGIAHGIEAYLNRQQIFAFGTRRIVIKVTSVFIYFMVFIAALNLLGIPLTVFAVFSGAVGVGIGLGLQRTASNFFSGIIMLGDNAIKEGDLIELENGIFGYIRKIGGRSTLIEQPSGKETLVPNEMLTTVPLTNYTLTNKRARVEVKVGVAYDSDMEKVKEILLEEAAKHPRCIDDPRPDVFLTDFGDNSVNFLLFFWVDDVTDGLFTPRSDVYLAIWKRFRAEGIEIPFPQRDLWLRTPISQPKA